MEASLSDDLDADENDKASLVERLEEEFSLSIPPEEAQKFKTVQDIAAYIKEHRQK